MKILELFGGIGACTQALKRLGIDFEIADYVEIDKYAVKSYNAINGTSFDPQDITKYNKDIQADLIMHGSPCQDFSVAGKQAGGDKGSGTRSSLMYETIRIVDKLKPKYVIWENVKNLLSKKHKHNFEAYLETMGQLGYNNYYQVVNAKDYGIPQNRERVFTVSIRKDIDNGTFKFPEPEELKLKLKDLLEDNVDEKYFLSDKMISYITKNGTSTFKNNDSKINLDIARPLTTKQDKRAGTTNYISNDLPNNYDLSLYVKNATKKGYDEAIDGDSVNLQHLNSNTRRGRVGHQVSNTLQCSDTMGVVIEPKVIGGIGNKCNNGTQYHLQNRIYEGDIAITVTTCCNPYYKNGLRIRKLTPRECWRLMGFDDKDFNKAQEVNSNTQLYKQAGNSIVVNVLEKILINLLEE